MGKDGVSRLEISCTGVAKQVDIIKFLSKMPFFLRSEQLECLRVAAGLCLIFRRIICRFARNFYIWESNYGQGAEKDFWKIISIYLFAVLFM